MIVQAQKPAALLLIAVLAACGDSTTSSDNTGGAGGTIPAPTVEEGVYDFLATELNFYYPEGLSESDTDATNLCGLDTITDNTTYRPLLFDDVVVNGFDLDDAVSTGDSGLCAQADYTGIDGSSGVDYGFLGIIDMIRPIRPDQVARGVLANAPSEGLINFGIRLSGVESLENDDSVEVFVAPTSEVPLRGTDGRIIPRSSVPIDPNPEWQTTFRGQIVDGVLTTEPADFTLGNIDLIIVFDRVLELRGARIRATFTEIREGVIEVDSILAGWWSNDNMIDTIGDIVLAIGANDGELQCSAEMWADGSSDGTSCDMTSMIFRTVSVSGFLTGFEEAN
ncbi:MAG: hypothetical protein OEM15_03190 [Myxococcales bacterium]|nr:hypothetical protein [Myxococcales bacterium]MDH3485887.1 hypothetical protein [Myxococcales bacterium]